MIIISIYLHVHTSLILVLNSRDKKRPEIANNCRKRDIMQLQLHARTLTLFRQKPTKRMLLATFLLSCLLGFDHCLSVFVVCI